MESPSVYEQYFQSEPLSAIVYDNITATCD